MSDIYSGESPERKAAELMEINAFLVRLAQPGYLDRLSSEQRGTIIKTLKGLESKQMSGATKAPEKEKTESAESSVEKESKKIAAIWNTAVGDYRKVANTEGDHAAEKEQFIQKIKDALGDKYVDGGKWGTLTAGPFHDAERAKKAHSNQNPGANDPTFYLIIPGAYRLDHTFNNNASIGDRTIFDSSALADSSLLRERTLDKPAIVSQRGFEEAGRKIGDVESFWVEQKITFA